MAMNMDSCSNNSNKKSLVVVDLDGTLINFKSIDNKIINELFGKNYVVRFLDRILWKINELDYFSNCYAIFNIRIKIYAMFSKYTNSEIMGIYGDRYIELALNETVSGYNHIKSLRGENSEVIIVTHNVFADRLNKYVSCVPIIFSLNKKKYFTEELLKKYNIIYLIGNNYTDDIKAAYAVKAFPIYIGKSKLVKKLIKGRGKIVDNIKGAIDFIKTNR